MSEVKRDYKIGSGKPPQGRPFQKGQSGNPRTRFATNWYFEVMAGKLAALCEGRIRRLLVASPCQVRVMPAGV
jgi:hypothetical protein